MTYYMSSTTCGTAIPKWYYC